MRRRLVLSYLSLTLFVLLALGLPLGLTFANTERRRLVSDVQHDAFALALRADEYVHNAAMTTSPLGIASAVTAAPATPPIATLERIVDRYHRRLGGRVVVVDLAGTVVADSSSGPTNPLTPDAADDLRREPELAAALRGREATGQRTSRRPVAPCSQWPSRSSPTGTPTARCSSPIRCRRSTAGSSATGSYSWACRA